MKNQIHCIVIVGLLWVVANTLLLADSVPALVNGLTDPDVNARRTAVGGLLKIASQAMPVLASNPDTSGLTDVSVQKALIKATSDPDAPVRQAALETYAFTYKLTPELENKIIAEFNSPGSELPHQPSTRPALIEMLMIGGSPSPHATEFLTKLLNDPKWAPHVATRIATDNCPLAGPALGMLADKLGQEKDPVSRAAYARAIGAYGKQAQQYKPELEAAFANEKDDVAKANIKAAIDRTNQ